MKNGSCPLGSPSTAHGVTIIRHGHLLYSLGSSVCNLPDPNRPAGRHVPKNSCGRGRPYPTPPASTRLCHAVTLRAEMMELADLHLGGLRVVQAGTVTRGQIFPPNND